MLTTADQPLIVHAHKLNPDTVDIEKPIAFGLEMTQRTGLDFHIGVFALNSDLRVTQQQFQ